MALTQRTGDALSLGECRSCRTFCDKVVEPRGCLELRCPYLYSYEEPLDGNRYMGCLHKVFQAEIDVELFELAERAGSFGALRMTGRPLPHCPVRVEPSYEGDGADYACVNPGFFDADLGSPEASVFDLRDSLN